MSVSENDDFRVLIQEPENPGHARYCGQLKVDLQHCSVPVFYEVKTLMYTNKGVYKKYAIKD
jgi:hypothetical protein